ncbi:uncharacterized protein LOC113227090 [Hyposmocoma kahamanoa]|uniref:uncharacterized protein LOC113227090 n=1 Tax=Hyposmocoma kahamanoa TaxID=1477025 RepID=UPI000E6DA159|nr:uncharacterized protein LOC113227090 [Hyposmocoma kahamanoa]
MEPVQTSTVTTRYRFQVAIAGRALARPAPHGHCLKGISLGDVLGGLSAFGTVAIIGDINIDITPNKFDTTSLDYQDLIAHYGLYPGHFFTTREDSGTCIDHTILRTSLAATTLVLDATITDHYAVLLSVETNSRIPCRKISRIDFIELDEAINQIDFDTVYSTNDVNVATRCLILPIRLAIKRCTKSYYVSHRRRALKPWITPGLIKCMRHRDNLYRKLKKHPNDEILKLSYKRYRNFCNARIKNAKRHFEREEIRKAGRDGRRLWEAIGKVANVNKPKNIADLLLKVGSSPQSSIDLVNHFFVNVGPNLAHTNMQSSGSNYNLPERFYGKSFAMLETDEREVEQLINSLKADCATGWDDISGSLIRRYKNLIIPPLTYICNLSISTGVFPEQFKTAVIHPIYKAGDRGRFNSYRPISVLSALSKILERILNNRLVNFLETTHLLSVNQFGFRKGRSTADAVHQLVDHVVINLDNRRGCLGIFLDLAKAFDTVSIPRLLHKLQSLGLRGPQFDIFRSYLSERTQYVKIGAYTSDAQPITFGVPQGSILGPTLFLVYINDLCDLQLQNCKIFSYADDTALIFSGADWDETYQSAQAGFSVVRRWLNDNLLTLNAEKTKVVPFSIRNHTISDNSQLKIAVISNHVSVSTTFLEITNSIKYLGVLIDSNLNFRQHINLLSARIRKLIYIFKSLRHVADPYIMKMVYLALGQSLFTYCISVWGGAARTHFILVERAQRVILKVACFKPYRFPTTDLYDFCQVLTVRQLFILWTVLRQHTLTPYDSGSDRRNCIVASCDRLRTAFSHRFFCFLGYFLYNKLHRELHIFGLNNFECKKRLANWLQKLNYDDTEKLLHPIV